MGAPTRKAAVDGRDVVVLDDLLTRPEVLLVTSALKAGKFSKTEFARRETAEYRHWVAELDPRDIQRQPIFATTVEAVEEHFGGGYALFRCYCNVALFGDMLMTHTDCGPKDEVVTALWYMCAEWNLEWGGETLFFDATGDAVFVVSPRPGRLVVFDGAITHVGRPPNRICYEPRFTLALKFARR
jgi:Rps23 Pro-64 3,4-dihydroxylase Tpa1-like proline 4-hydroxylase